MSIKKTLRLGVLAWLGAAPLSAAFPASEIQALHLTETSGRASTVALRLFKSDGTLIRETNVTVPPYAKTQVNANNTSLFPDGVNIDDASLEVKPVSGAGSVAAFATVIDNASQGSTMRTGRFVPQVLSASSHPLLAVPTRLVIPTAAHGPGARDGELPGRDRDALRRRHEDRQRPRVQAGQRLRPRSDRRSPGNDRVLSGSGARPGRPGRRARRLASGNPS
jgi:hypothetical protein